MTLNFLVMYNFFLVYILVECCQMSSISTWSFITVISIYIKLYTIGKKKVLKTVVYKYRGLLNNFVIALVICCWINSDWVYESDFYFPYWNFCRFPDLVSHEEDKEFGRLLQKLVELDIPGLPPGGGLAAK